MPRPRTSHLLALVAGLALGLAAGRRAWGPRPAAAYRAQSVVVVVGPRGLERVVGPFATAGEARDWRDRRGWDEDQRATARQLRRP